MPNLPIGWAGLAHLTLVRFDPHLQTIVIPNLPQTCCGNIPRKYHWYSKLGGDFDMCGMRGSDGWKRGEPLSD